MNRERAIKLLPVIRAFADGKEVEWRDNDLYKEWQTGAQEPTFDEPSNEWRIKPEPREFWINIYGDGYEPCVHPTLQSAEEECSPARKEVIKVREVME